MPKPPLHALTEQHVRVFVLERDVLVLKHFAIQPFCDSTFDELPVQPGGFHFFSMVQEFLELF